MNEAEQTYLAALEPMMSEGNAYTVRDSKQAAAKTSKFYGACSSRLPPAAAYFELYSRLTNRSISCVMRAILVIVLLAGHFPRWFSMRAAGCKFAAAGLISFMRV